MQAHEIKHGSSSGQSGETRRLDFALRTAVQCLRADLNETLLRCRERLSAAQQDAAARVVGSGITRLQQANSGGGASLAAATSTGTEYSAGNGQPAWMPQQPPPPQQQVVSGMRAMWEAVPSQGAAHASVAQPHAGRAPNTYPAVPAPASPPVAAAAAFQASGPLTAPAHAPAPAPAPHAPVSAPPVPVSQQPQPLQPTLPQLPSSVPPVPAAAVPPVPTAQPMAAPAPPGPAPPPPPPGYQGRSAAPTKPPSEPTASAQLSVETV